MQDQILAMAKEVPALKEKYVSERIRFLGHFFEEAEDQADLIHNFDRHCIGPS
jgi:hypothetical protein